MSVSKKIFAMTESLRNNREASAKSFVKSLCVGVNKVTRNVKITAAVYQSVADSLDLLGKKVLKDPDCRAKVELLVQHCINDYCSRMNDVATLTEYVQSKFKVEIEDIQAKFIKNMEMFNESENADNSDKE